MIYVFSNIFTIFLHLMAAIFGGMMGCAIGMSVAAACELIYWITLKPFVKWINATKGNHLSPRAKHFYYLTRNLTLLSCIIYCVYRFHQVYVAFETRNYWLLCDWKNKLRNHYKLLICTLSPPFARFCFWGKTV